MKATAGLKSDKSIRQLMTVLLLVLTALMPAGETLANATSGKVRVGYYENEVFQEGAKPGAVKKGYAYEYYRKLSEYTGWRYEYIYGTYGDLYAKLLKGEVDLLAGLAWKEDRVGRIGYPTASMGREEYSLVRHADDMRVTTDPFTLNGRSIGVLEGAMNEMLRRYLTGHRVVADVRVFQDPSALFSAFDAKEIDVLATEGYGAYGRDHAEVTGSYGASDYFLCVSIRRPDLLAELNTAQTMMAALEPHYLNYLRMRYYASSLTARTFTPEEREWLATHKTLRVGYLDNYLPYSDTDEKGEVTGLVQVLLPEMCRRLDFQDLEITYTGYQSYDAMIADMTNEKLDVAFPVGGGLYFSEENGIYLSTPVTSSPTELVYRDYYDEQKINRFAVNENNRIQYYYIRTIFPLAGIIFYSSIEECLDAVLSGEADCTTLNGLRASDILRNSQYEGLSVRQLNHADPHSFGVEIGNEGLLMFLNRGMNVVGDDYVQNMAYRYTDGLYTYQLTDMLREHIALFGTMVLAVAAMVIFLLFRDARRTKKEMAEKEAARLELEAKNQELADSQQALSAALTAANQASHAKTMFLNNMSHDIRTPMNAIIGFTELAALHLDSRERMKEYLSRISVSSQHLLSLINDVLDMSRIESGKMTLAEAEVHLPDLIHDIQTILQARIAEKHFDFFVDVRDIVNEDIITDKLRLNQVLLNLLTNAIKFTPDGGTICFSVSQRPHEDPGYTTFEFRVKDSGIGMSPKFQQEIFEAFSRERSTTVSGIQGTGLGMAITRNILDIMGGQIQVHSQEGRGSEFVVTLPCRISGQPAQPEALPGLAGRRALVADDDENSGQSLCAMLRGLGMRPEWTDNGREAVDRAGQALQSGDEFCVYIIDWKMPGMDGLETVRRIRQTAGDDATVILLTGHDWSDVEAEGRAAGVTAFCLKPLFLSELRHVLAKPDSPSAAGKQAEAPPSFAGRRVLVAEDSDLNQMIVTEILESVGFEVDLANDGTEAVQRVQDAPPHYYDIILMDIQMPNMNGYEAARRIRALADPEKAGIPIVAVTANAFEEDRRQALEAGMNTHLAKPYEIPIMLETLKALLQ